jgi:hypothetical protein
MKRAVSIVIATQSEAKGKPSSPARAMTATKAAPFHAIRTYANEDAQRLCHGRNCFARTEFA